mmetsp:Transcript_28081/g.80696  ORF Transcript_28081/g.80696 Transcript_28081/m.80696 type:complete len:241 (-) Transcript_28081:318-1040(-)
MDLAAVQVLDDQQLHVILPIVCGLQRRQHAVRHLEGVCKVDEVLGAELALTSKLPQVRQGLSCLERREHVLDRVQERQADLHDHAPSNDQESIPDSAHDGLRQVAREQCEEPLDRVVLRVDAMPHQGDVHLRQEAFHNSVELPHDDPELREFGPVEVDQGVPQEQSQSALEDVRLVVGKDTDQGRDNEVQALAVPDVRQSYGDRPQQTKQRRLSLAVLFTEELLLWQRAVHIPPNGRVVL